MMKDAAAYMAERRKLEENEKARQGIEVALAELARRRPAAAARAGRTTIAPTTLTKARQIAEHVRRVSRESDPSDLVHHARELEQIAATLKRALS
jgi:hypothetical protein